MIPVFPSKWDNYPSTSCLQCGKRHGSAKMSKLPRYYTTLRLIYSGIASDYALKRQAAPGIDHLT